MNLLQRTRNLFSRQKLKRIYFSAYVKRKQFDQKWVNEFKQKFGTNAVAFIGNWSLPTNWRGQPPTKGKGYRKIFRLLGGIPTYLVNEKYTSKRCSNCRTQANTRVHFLKRQNPRPHKNNIIDVWGLLRCNSCGATHNR